jgi:Sulfotransferase family
MSGFAFHLIGAGRGGTSLIAGLIDTHPDCVVHFEEFSIGFLMGKAPTLAESEHNPTLRTAARIANFVSACEAASIAFPNKLWGHKTTTEQIAGLGSVRQNLSPPSPNAEDIHALDAFVENLIDVPTIFILRDGRTCVRSKAARTGQPIEVAVRRWKYSIRVLNLLKERSPRLLVIKFEDLITNPESTMRAVTLFLGVPYDPIVLSGTENQKMLPEYRSKIFDTKKIYVEEESHQEWIEDIRPELVANGYM